METNYKTLKNETFRKTIKNNNPLLYQNLYGIFSTKNIFTPNKSIERGKTFIEGHCNELLRPVFTISNRSFK